MTIFFVTCQNDVSGQSTTIQVSGHDPLEASLKATARCQREWNTVQVSSVSVSTTKPRIEKEVPVREQRKPRQRMGVRGSAVSDRGDAKPIQSPLL